jgi:hypothetical protein
MPSAYLASPFPDLVREVYVARSGECSDMSDFERAWQAWMRLGRIEREQFLQRLREVYAEERADRQRANGTGTRDRGPQSLSELSVSAADLAG